MAGGLASKSAASYPRRALRAHARFMISVAFGLAVMTAAYVVPLRHHHPSRSRSSARTTCMATSFPRADVAVWRCSGATSRHFARRARPTAARSCSSTPATPSRRGIESNLSEGALVVDAYNMLGYTAAAIGNHEFDFGPVDAFRPSEHPDPQGALKAIAARARYPFLAANLVDGSTGSPVGLAECRTLGHGQRGRIARRHHRSDDGRRAGRRWRSTSMGCACRRWRRPESEAAALRSRGADLVLLTIHAGGRCTQFADPHDLSSCDAGSEIVRLVHDLPDGTLDGIVAGHTHAGMAHIVDGIPIIEALWGGRAFGRMDLTIDRATNKVTRTRLFPPQDLCGKVNAAGDACVNESADGAVKARYEGRTIEPDADVIRAMEPAPPPGARSTSSPASRNGGHRHQTQS